MQSFYRQLQRPTCNGKEAETKKEETFQEALKEQQRIERSEICQEQEEEENREGIATFSRNAAFRQ